MEIGKNKAIHSAGKTGTSIIEPCCNLSRRSALVLAATAVMGASPGYGASSDPVEGEGGAIRQPEKAEDRAFIQRAFDMRQRAVDAGDRPYGAVVVRDRVIIGQSGSRVILDEDPTAHAELAAIRDAARRTQSRALHGAVLYSSARPCPMCEAAAYWAGIDAMIHGQSMHNAGSPALCR